MEVKLDVHAELARCSVTLYLGSYLPASTAAYSAAIKSHVPVLHVGAQNVTKICQ